MKFDKVNAPLSELAQRERDKQLETQKRKLFYAVISFKAPVGGTTSILARDEAHARELLAEQHKEVGDFKIIDIHDMDNDPEFKKLLEQAQSNNQEGGSTPQVLN